MKFRITRQDIRSNLPYLTAAILILYLGSNGYLQRALLMTGLANASGEADLVHGTPLSSDFLLTDLDGQEMAFSELRGKTVFVNLWATWCGPCRAEMPSIASLYARTDSESVAFVMITRDDPAKQREVRQYLESNGFDFPVYWAKTRLPAELKSSAIPATFVLSPQGKVIYKHVGIANYDTDAFRQMLEEAVKY